MATYHLHVQIISRKTGRSSVAAAAYRAAEKLHNKYDGIAHDYTRKTGVVHSEILLPENAPRGFANRATLWNAVEQVEKRVDSQTAREIDVALPVEFSRQEQIEIVREYVQKNFVDCGMCADFAIHDKGDGNPHAHIMLTTRHVIESGFGGKNRDWNHTPVLEKWRENWAVICNERFKEKGLDIRIDHRTLEAQGIDREPTIHVGVVGMRMEQKGRDSERVRECREIVARNKAREVGATPEATAEYIHELKQCYIIVDMEVSEIQQEINDIGRKVNIFRVKAEEIEERVEQIRVMKGQGSRSYMQAETYFKQTFHITPEESGVEIKRIESKAADLERAKNPL